MAALWAALGCSLMMVMVLPAGAWFMISGRPRKDSPPSADAAEVARLRTEVAELRHRQQDPSQLPGRW